MDLWEYREFVTERIPLPAAETMLAWARYVAEDHSWYKHLPLWGPGEPFMFVLAPHADRYFLDSGTEQPGWRDIVVGADHPRPGFRSFRIERLHGDQGLDESHERMLLHGVRMTTAESRQRFGYWTYWNHGRPEESREVHVARAMEHLTVADDDGNRMTVPREVLETGLVYLNGTVSGSLSFAGKEYERLRSEHDLPEHSQVRAMQLAAMQEAMERVSAMVWDRP